MEVAVLDSNKKVLNTISVKKNQCQNASNEFEIEATTTNCRAMFKTNLDYVPNVQPTICKNNPDVGDTWYPAHKIFVEDKANIGGYESWTINTSTGNWEAPENYDIEKSQGMQKFTWHEDITKWRAQKDSETETSNWYQWNNSTKAWDAV